MIQSIILGLLQGLTEFLPVSSSAHLALAQAFFGFSEPMLTFDIALHFATMIATMIYFREDLVNLGGQWFSGLVRPDSRKTPGWNIGWAMIAGTAITVALALPLKPLVERLSTSVFAGGVALLVTGGILCLASSMAPRTGAVRLFNALPMGLAQGLAVIPGISRSGATIVAGMISGLSPQEAFRLSFLMSLPAVLGATILELKDVSSAAMPSGWLVGMVASGVSGYFALKVLHKVVTLGRWRGFALYCVAVGLIAMFIGR
ncbi:undecaprenyl-diphosphate phosphatase [Dethiosulfovibrio salsuginis]|uniref:Undecaprenyl-diphosphatase n=1 Tax=Dethiosulfovibrio salsuginis TaxID=561720 RepID=A0A1X7K5A9_9BACT|nr:undecaprenyl-diphosphate phosphatase [Dethiosulfovibrio salsuginis]SMG36134.1 undecaprenyl-diphosphatase [Dethiosulfovibrio salsuginis]